MTDPFPSPRLLALVQRWSEDSITDPEVTELEQILCGHPQGPRFFAELTHLDRSLVSLGPSLEETFLTPLPGPPPTPAGRFSAAEILALAALVILAVAVLGVLFPGTEPVPPSASPPTAQPAIPLTAEDEPLAFLTHSIGATWAGPAAGLREGESLPRGRLFLTAGLAHIQFFSGVKLILEGPAELETRSPASVLCLSGRFYASIPLLAGAFLLETPQGQITDNGAEFGLEVDPQGATTIHVFQGRLVFRTPDITRLAHLRQDQAAVLRNLESPRLFTAEPARFVSDTQLLQWHALHRERALNEWYVSSLPWRRDPRLLAFFDFDSPDYLRSVIPALTSVPSLNERLEGVLIGPRRADGRWPGKMGFSFTEPSQRIRIQIPGYYDALTLLTWVCPSEVPDRPYSLLVSDGFGHGSVHWRLIGPSGQLSLRTRRHRGEEAVYSGISSPAAALQPGRWTMLSCVYDRLQNRVLHFINGEPAGENPLKVNVRLEIGVAEIGNAADPAGPPTFFPGIIDEFAIYQGALTPAEIQTLYELGHPD